MNIYLHYTNNNNGNNNTLPYEIDVLCNINFTLKLLFSSIATKINPFNEKTKIMK